MRVSLRCSPSFSRSSRRGRLTTFGRSRGRYSFVAKMGVTCSLLQPLPRSFFPSRNGATRNVEQIDAFDSRCDHQHPSCKSSLWSVPTGSTVSRRRTQFTALKRSIPDGERFSQARSHQCSLLSPQNLLTCHLIYHIVQYSF